MWLGPAALGQTQSLFVSWRNIPIIRKIPSAETQLRTLLAPLGVPLLTLKTRRPKLKVNSRE